MIFLLSLKYRHFHKIERTSFFLSDGCKAVMRKLIWRIGTFWIVCQFSSAVWIQMMSWHNKTAPAHMVRINILQVWLTYPRLYTSMDIFGVITNAYTWYARFCFVFDRLWGQNTLALILHKSAKGADVKRKIIYCILYCILCVFLHEWHLLVQTKSHKIH